MKKRDKCTRCGRCCKAEVCPLGLLFKPDAIEPCYALEFDGKVHSCGLVSNPLKHLHTHMKDKFKIMIGNCLEEIHSFGKGCDSDFIEER